MSRSSSAPAIPVASPSPPGSGPQLVDRDVDALIERCAHARSIDDLPPELRDDPFIVAIVTTPQDAARQAALDDADALYGEDPQLALAAFAAGTHPLQRGLAGEALEESKRLARAPLARADAVS